MPGDIRSFFGGSAKNPASPKPPAAPEAKADVAMVDLTDDPPAPASGNKRKAQDALDVRARSSLRVSRAVGDVLGGCLPPSGLSANPRRKTRSETTSSHRKKTENRNVRFDRRYARRDAFSYRSRRASSDPPPFRFRRTRHRAGVLGASPGFFQEGQGQDPHETQAHAREENPDEERAAARDPRTAGLPQTRVRAQVLRAGVHRPVGGERLQSREPANKHAKPAPPRGSSTTSRASPS